MKQGTRANLTGRNLETFIENTLKSKGYDFVKREDFKSYCYLQQPIYSKQFDVGESIYGIKINCDFVLYHPTRHPGCLIIETKWQQSKGSVDEKFPYLVLNIKEQYPYGTIIVLDGDGYKPGAKKWLREQVGGNLRHVFTMMEFQIWSNSEEL